MSEPVQVFVRNDKGKVWGPLTPATVELLIDNGILTGRVQVALDGVNYMYPGRVPDVRQYFPRELWGDAVAPGADLDAPPPPPPPVPTEMSGDAAAPEAPAGGPVGVGPMAGPGVTGPRAGPGVTGPRAGPGVTGARAGSGARPSVSGRGFPPVVGPAAGARPATSNRNLAPVVTAAPEAPVLEAEVLVGEVLEAEVLTAEVISAEVAAPELGPEPGTSPGGPPTLVPAAPPLEAPADLPAQGSLSDLTPIRLYYVAAAGDATGLLTLRTTGHVLELHFRKGSPEFFGSDHPDDAVGAFLLRQGLLNQGQLDQAEAARGKFGGELVAALFGLGIINPSSAFTQLAQRAQGILLKALVAETGTFTFEAVELPAHRAMPLGNKWGLLTEQVRKIPVAEVRRRLGEAVDLPVMKSGGRVQPADLKLTPQETRALTHFDGVRSLAQLAHELPQDADNSLRIAWYLQQLDAVSFAAVRVPPPPPPPQASPQPRLDQVAEAKTQPGTPGPNAAKPAAAPGAKPAAAPAKPAAAPAKPAAAPAKPATAPAKPAAAAAPAGPVDVQAELKKLEEMAAKVRTQSHFELLAVKKDADAAAVRVAYLKLARLFHPDTVPPEAPEVFGKLKEEIFGRIGEAQRVLTDPKAREDYLYELESGTSEKVDIAKILAAEDLFQKGTLLVKARKFPEAVKALDEALKGNPDEGEYYAWRGYAKFFSAADKKSVHNEALRDINLCVAKNPRCAPAYYFLGHMAKVLGDLPGAKKHFHKCVELQPDHLEATRELRLMK